MMQETGSNLNEINKILSIRLAPSGLYFYLTNEKNEVLNSGWIENRGLLSAEINIEAILREAGVATDADQYSSVRVSSCQKENLLVPAEAYRADLVSSYVSLCQDAELDNSRFRAVSCEQRESIVEIFVLPVNIVESLERLYAGKIVYESALMNLYVKDNIKGIKIASYLDMISLVLSDAEGLKFAQNMPSSSFADTLVYIETLMAEHKLSRDTNIYIDFDQSGKLFNELKKYYKRVRIKGK